jgi:hypothetical protein
MMASHPQSLPLLPFVISLFSVATLTTTVARADICTQSVCEYTWIVRHARTMTYVRAGKTYNVALNGSRLEVVKNDYRRYSKKDIYGQAVSPDDVITADGRPRDVIVINDQFPGPTIEVLEESEVRY